MAPFRATLETTNRDRDTTSTDEPTLPGTDSPQQDVLETRGVNVPVEEAAEAR